MAKQIVYGDQAFETVIGLRRARPDDLVSDYDREAEAQTKAGWAPGSKTA